MISLDSHLRLKSTAAVVFMLLCAAVIGYMQYLTPWQGDDLGYGFAFKDAMEGKGQGIGWHDGWKFVVSHYLSINGRISDKLIVWVITDLPKWMLALISGMACLSMFYFGSRAAFGSIKKHPLRACILTGMLICCMPWFVSMLMANMVLNYLWGTGLLAIVLWLFLRQRNINAWGCIGLFLLSALTGGWHEASCVPLSAGMMLFLVLNKGYNRKIRYVIVGGTLAGLMFTLTAPGFWVRKALVDSGIPYGQQPLGIMLHGLAGGINFGFLAGLAPVMLWFKRWRKPVNYPMLTFGCMACVCIAVAIAIYFATFYTLRTFWYIDLVALIAVAMLYGKLSARLHLWVRRISGFGFILFIIVHLVSACGRQVRISRQYYEILREFIISDDGTVYYDYDGRGYGSPLNLRKAQIFAFVPEYRFDYQLLQLFHRHDTTILSIVPTALRDFDMSRWPDGRNTAVFNGYAISNDTALASHRKICICPRYDYADGHSEYIRTMLNPFKAKDSTQLYYLEIDTRIANDKNVVNVKL